MHLFNQIIINSFLQSPGGHRPLPLHDTLIETNIINIWLNEYFVRSLNVNYYMQITCTGASTTPLGVFLYSQ